MTTTAHSTETPVPLQPLVAAALLLVIELGVIGVLFKHGIDFTCLESWPPQACRTASGAMVSTYVVFALFILAAVVRPDIPRTLFAAAGRTRQPLFVNIAGFGIALLPAAFMEQGNSATVIPAFLCWTVGFILLIGGLLLYLAPAPRWRDFFVANFWTFSLLILAGAFAPLLAAELRPIWRLDTIAALTFTAVSWLIELLGFTVQADAPSKTIGSENFAINIAPVCSGVEGIALVTIFVTIFLVLFRQELRFPRALLLFPIGIIISALLNVVRITLLLAIGLRGNPELAVGGFHSHAGWLMFTAIALGIVLGARQFPILRKDTATPTATIAPPALRNDWTAARILPFAVFMLTALLAATLVSTPALVYPLRVVIVGMTMVLFLPLLRALPWRLDPLSILLGLAVGLVWIVVPAEEGGAAPYGALAGFPLVVWFIMRGLGTIVLVPILEELFFRDYLEGRLRAVIGIIPAAILSAGLFAALHDRYVEAFFAGLIFSFLMWRSKRVTDAILAHATANAVVFGYAAATGAVHII
ncbi:hypothetical protein SAMN05421688_0245 [Poseidonocella pacifica]|uniref:CAAX prenyl protease 2/Lysostaphin resistance protein A-like domain-containing protein n=1 Tax=Poseidonocella pacifica TaxID=871651 RepID=A0A1I0V314_9RHOB|nr:exosortase E/protease, VPEID-CTERM system [Poseidonocella pacifica]SFA70724.1 hypothetical protein SAMN05421688_0245 [Poseidonocella pacifica]